MAREAERRKREHEKDLKRRTRWGVFRWTPELEHVPNHELPKLAVDRREFRTERAAQAAISCMIVRRLKWTDPKRPSRVLREEDLVTRFWIVGEED